MDYIADRLHSEKKSNYILFGFIIFLLFLGLNVLLASSSFLARQEFGDPYYYLKKQALFALMGLGLLFFLSRVHYMKWKEFAWPIYMISILLLTLVFVPGLGKKAGGASRWINLGIISIQPSDLARFAVVVLLTRLYSNNNFQGIKRTALTFLLAMLPVGLIFLEPDFSTAFHFGIVILALLFLTDFPLVYIFLTIITSFPVIYYGVVQVPYRWDRIKAFIDPIRYRYEGAYQLIASFQSFEAGGVFGQGLGEGIRRHNLSARHTDFILSVVAEDLGFAGIFILYAAYLGIILYSLYLISSIEENFGRLLGSGIILIFAFQVTINIAVTMGLVPTTGINMPFMSYGGTSLLVYCAMFGILLNIMRENNDNG